MEYKTREVISQDVFVQATEELLIRAEGAGGSFQETLDAATIIATRVDQVDRGDLEVQPPISQEQLNDYAERARRVQNVAGKAIKGLEQSAASSRSSRRERRSQRSYQGHGSSAKRF